jgi:hypothetical protein
MDWKYRTVGALVCALLLFVAPAAFAQPSAETGYSTPTGDVQQQLGGASDTARLNTVVVENRGGSLPFTGLDVGLAGAAGGFLLAIGLAARRLSRSEIS